MTPAETAAILVRLADDWRHEEAQICKQFGDVVLPQSMRARRIKDTEAIYAAVEMIERLEAAEKDAIEQARLNGMGAERELALMAKLEVVEKERASLRADKATLQQMTYSLKDRLEVAEKEVALKERMIDALGSELNAVANERDALRTVLTDLLNDLEERAKWNLEENQRVVACGNGVYVRAKAALEETK